MKFSEKLFCGLLGLVGVGATNSSLWAVTVLNVPSEYATIASALSASAGATEENPVEIRIADGEYQQTATLTVPSYVTLRGNDADPSQVQIVGGGSTAKFLVLDLSAQSAARGVWVQNGYPPSNATPGGVRINTGATLSYAWVSGCWVVGDHGGGVENINGTVSHCKIFGCMRGAAKQGMGMRQSGANAVTEYSEICNNRCESVTTSGVLGGGAYIVGGLVSHCLITNNMAGPVQGSNTSYGGVYLASATMEHCLIADNAAMNTGGVYLYNDGKATSAPTILRNCTITGNRSKHPGGLVRAATNTKNCIVLNTIVWDNVATFANADGDQDLLNLEGSGIAVTGLCTRASLGAYPVAGDPVFVDPANGDYRLAANSPCRGASLDADGHACDIGYLAYDGAAARDQPVYSVQPQVFVSKSGSKTAPYDTPEKAADDIFDALNYCGDGTVLTVDDGIYEIDRQILLDHAITLKSASGDPSSVTFKTKSGTQARTLKIAHAGAVADGITFAGGTLSQDVPLETGSLAAVSFGQIRNCVMELGSTENVQNAGANVDNYSGLVKDSLIRDTKGGGAKGCGYHQSGTDPLIVNTMITGCQGYHNSAAGAGAYLESGVMDRCQIVTNLCSGSSSGVGVYGSLCVDGAAVRSTVIAENKANNKANKCSGVRLGAGAVMDNCTVVSNAAQAASADGVVGGIAFTSGKAATIRNTVIYGNTVNNYAKAPQVRDYINYSESVEASNNAVAQLSPSIAFGANCLEIADGAPLFTDAAAGDYQPANPGILVNRGIKLDWMHPETLDAAGHNRISQVIPDIGAYERQIYHMIFSIY